MSGIASIWDAGVTRLHVLIAKLFSSERKIEEGKVMRYPAVRPRKCITIDRPDKGVYCATTGQYIGNGVCGLCYDHYSQLSNKAEDSLL